MSSHVTKRYHGYHKEQGTLRRSNRFGFQMLVVPHSTWKDAMKGWGKLFISQYVLKTYSAWVLFQGLHLGPYVTFYKEN